jgi:hypothetical protein
MPDEDGCPATWDEAVAASERAEPVEVIRSPRKVTITYRWSSGTCVAESPEIPGFRAYGDHLAAAREAARERLGTFLDPAVEIVEIP